MWRCAEAHPRIRRKFLSDVAYFSPVSQRKDGVFLSVSQLIHSCKITTGTILISGFSHPNSTSTSFHQQLFKSHKVWQCVTVYLKLNPEVHYVGSFIPFRWLSEKMGQISRLCPLLSTIYHSRLQKLLHVCELYRLNHFIVHLLLVQRYGEGVLCGLICLFVRLGFIILIIY